MHSREINHQNPTSSTLHHTIPSIYATNHKHQYLISQHQILNNNGQLTQQKNISSASSPNNFRNPRNRGKLEKYYFTHSTENESDTDRHEPIKKKW